MINAKMLSTLVVDATDFILSCDYPLGVFEKRLLLTLKNTSDFHKSLTNGKFDTTHLRTKAEKLSTELFITAHNMGSNSQLEKMIYKLSFELKKFD